MKRIRPFVVVGVKMAFIVGAFLWLATAARPAMEYREQIAEIESLRQEALLTGEPVAHHQVLATMGEEVKLLRDTPWFMHIRRTVGRGDDPVAIKSFQAAFQLEDWCRAVNPPVERWSSEDFDSERMIKDLREGGWSGADTLLGLLMFVVAIASVVFLLFMSPSERRRWLYGKDASVPAPAPAPVPAPVPAPDQAPAPPQEDPVSEEGLT